MAAAEAGREVKLARLAAEAEARVRDRVAVVTEAARIRPVPLQRRVQMQLAALLASMAYVRERRGPA
jgi:hypothetical protein